MVKSKSIDNSIKESNKEAGNNIRKRRLALNKSQEDVGEYVGVDRATIQRYESGFTEVKRNIAIKLAEVLKTTPAYIMGWQNDPESLGLTEELNMARAYASTAKNFSDHGIAPEDADRMTKIIIEAVNKR